MKESGANPGSRVRARAMHRRVRAGRALALHRCQRKTAAQSSTLLLPQLGFGLSAFLKDKGTVSTKLALLHPPGLLPSHTCSSSDCALVSERPGVSRVTAATPQHHPSIRGNFSFISLLGSHSTDEQGEAQ